MLHPYTNHSKSANWSAPPSAVTRVLHNLIGDTHASLRANARKIDGVCNYSQELTLNALRRMRRSMYAVVEKSRLTLDISHNPGQQTFLLSRVERM